MIKQEEIQSILKDENLTEEQKAEKIAGLSQEKGDLVKEKYEKLSAELKAEYESKLSKNAEDTEDKGSEENTKNDEVPEWAKALLDKVEKIENNERTKTTKQLLLEKAEAEGKDLDHASKMFDMFGENLSEDFDLSLIKDATKQTNSNKNENDDDGDNENENDVIIKTGNELMDAILNEE